jgi:hypothetical protein
MYNLEDIIYKDLLIGRFAIHKVVRIERRDDSDVISEKWADYSQTTIYNLIKEVIRDTIYILLSENANLVKKELKDESKEIFFNILIDQKYNESEKRYLFYSFIEYIILIVIRL